MNVRNRRLAAAALSFSLILAEARPALAHGFGPTYDIPIPLWLYLYGAAAAVVLAFLPLALFSRKERTAPTVTHASICFAFGSWERSLLHACSQAACACSPSRCSS